MILGVTGHRPERLRKGGFIGEDFWVSRAMSGLYELRPELVVTGFALGWDLAVAEACVRRGVPFIAALPYIGQEERWSAPAQGVYRRLLDKAVRVVVVSHGEYSPVKLFIRNEWIVGQSDEIMAMFDGAPKGGTFHCISYARKKGLPVHNMWNYPLV